MKLDRDATERFLAGPPPGIRCVLIYGPDGGQVRERARTLARAIVPDLSDAFRVSDLLGAAIDGQPGLLAAEAASLTLTGGRRVILVREVGERAAAAVKLLLADPAAGDSLAILEAGDLPARSPLRKLVEDASTAAAIPCYPDEPAAVARMARDTLARAGVQLTEDAAAWIGQSVVGDRALVRTELEKLALYAVGAQRLDLEDVRAVIGDQAEGETDALVMAMGAGETDVLDRTLGRLQGEGEAFVALLRAAQRHILRLHQVRLAADGGAPLDDALNRLQPPIFWKVKAAFKAQAQRWTAARLMQALERLVDTEAQSKQTGAPADVLTARALFYVASLARAR